MGKHVADNIIKKMIKAKIDIRQARIGILGLTFKENVADVRNTRVIDIIKELRGYDINPIVHDPYADPEEVQQEFNLVLADESELTDLDCVVLAVPHQAYTMKYTLESLKKLYRNDTRVLIDIKSLFDKRESEAKGYHYWSL